MIMNAIDREFFKNPTTDPDYSVSGFWFWNDLITDEKTKEQLDMMHRIHADQPVVHSRFGLQNEYLSQDWFDRIQSVLDTCKANKQKIWLYDENNWPSGNCSWSITKDEKYREHYLQFDKKELKAGERVCFDCNEKNYLNISIFKAEELVPLDIIAKETVTYQAAEASIVIAVYVAVDDYEPVGKLCVDYLSKEALQKFIDSTHEKYREHFEEEFGKIITGIFMDETRFCNAMPWTETLPMEFEKRKGYDIIPFLPLLLSKNDNSNLIRYDYYDVISDMYTEATFGQSYDWCHKYGIKSTGHFLGEETIAAQSYFGADMMRGYQYFDVPAIDHLGNGIGSLDAKFAVSACHSYGKTRIACEAFGASGWDITFEEMVKISNWLFQQGINQILMHGFYYSIRDERSLDFPPSYFFQWKYWDHMPMYAAMANRMMNLMSDGCHEAEILVYTPIESFWTDYEPDLETKTGFWKEGPWITGEKAKFIDNQFQLLCNGLTDRNMDYDILHSDGAKHYKVEGSQLVNILTGERFQILVLPLTQILTDEMVILLNEFMDNGGIVIHYQTEITNIVKKDGGHFRGDSLPVLDLSKAVKAAKLGHVFELCREHSTLPFEILCGVDEMSRSLSSYPARLIDPYIHDGEQVYGVGVSRYLKAGQRLYNFTNYNDKDEDLTVWVEAMDIPELFIPETGEIQPMNNAKPKDKGYIVSFTLPKNRTYFIAGKRQH